MYSFSSIEKTQTNTGSVAYLNTPMRGTYSYTKPEDSFTVSPTEYVQVPNLATGKPLEIAASFVEKLQQKDESTPILDERSYYNNGVNYNFSKTSLGAFQPFERTEVMQIPDEILQETNKSQLSSQMGIFSEIDRVWITVDNKLILWNLHNAHDFQSIDDIKHTILKVKLVKPKPQTFISSVGYLLLVATPFDIHVLAVSYNKKELNIYNTGMSVSVHGMQVNEFACNNLGQIFFSCKDLNIWELQYSATDDWFNNKCSKICLTQSSLANLLPSVSKYLSFLDGSNGASEEHIVQLAMDNSRGILYSLSNKSVIRCYKVNKGGLEGPYTLQPASIKRIISSTNAKDATILGDKYMQFTKISTVSQEENGSLFLVVITVGGVRLYFNGSASSQVDVLRLESIKFPPTSVTPEMMEQDKQEREAAMLRKPTFVNPLPTQLMYQRKSSVLLSTTDAATIISPGIFFTPVAKDGNQKLFVSVPDYGLLKYQNKYQENATFLDTSGGDIKEIVALTPPFNPTNRPYGYANEFATQYSPHHCTIAVLTTLGVEFFRYRTPDLVFEAMTDQPLPFITNYGITEACSSALFVACKYNKSETMRSNALSFFTMGLPGLEIKPKYNQFISSTTASMDNVILSARFYGIALLISRLYREIWAQRVFNTENNSISSISVSKDKIEYYLSSILILNEFFHNYGSSWVTTGSADEVANQAENIAINSMIKLASSMAESLSFLVVVYEEMPFKDLVGYCSADVQRDLQLLNFKDLFIASDHTKMLIREILSSIINKNLGNGGSIEHIAQALQERCGSFCSSRDVLGFRAMEHLRKANSASPDGAYHLTAAMTLFTKIDDMSLDKLKEATQMMLQTGAPVQQVIEFLLNMAHSMDKGDLALGYMQDGCLENDERKRYYDLRCGIYEMIFPMSTTLPLNNNDKLFHYKLYDWLLERDALTVDIQTAFIEPYLKEHATSIKVSNLLWMFYSKKGDFLKSAEILYSMALSEFTLTLSERIEYLSRAMGLCNGVAQRQELSTMISEVLDVAGIQDDILQAVTGDVRVETGVKQETIQQLNGPIKTISDLFNDYAEPLGYDEICLSIFKVSDFRNSEEILSKWKSVVERDGAAGIIRVGRRLGSSPAFPVKDLLPLVTENVVDTFVSAGVSYEKLYHILKDAGYNKEMVYLIKEWYKNDRRLREVVAHETIRDLTVYSPESDPIAKSILS